MTTARGIIRAPRRPEGWRAPGPAPAAPEHLQPRPGEDLCHLAGDWRVFQRLDGHRWSLDDLVTAWVAAQQVTDQPPSCIADLGCGIGAVLLLLAWRFPGARALGVEAQAVSVELARRSIAWNGVADRCAVVRGDLRDPMLRPGAFELVSGTPPYLPPGTATESRRIQVGASHVEHRGGIEAYAIAAAPLLAPGGVFVACAAGAHGERVAAAATAVALTVERRLDVVPRAGKATLFSVYAMRRRADAQAFRSQPPLVVRDERGHRTPDFRNVRRAMGMPP